MKEKVYCKGCKYLQRFVLDPHCYAKSDVKMYDSWYSLKVIMAPELARRANAYNVCHAYEKKPWWMFWRG